MEVVGDKGRPGLLKPSVVVSFHERLCRWSIGITIQVGDWKDQQQRITMVHML